MNKSEQNKLKVRPRVSLGRNGSWNEGKLFIDTIGNEIQIRVWMNGRRRDDPVYITLSQREVLLVSERLLSRLRTLGSQPRAE